MARRRSASLQARHVPGCASGKTWTPFAAAQQGCTCKKINGRGPLYHVVSRPNGKQIRVPTGYDREDARRQLLKVLGDIDEGRHVAPSTMTFEAWADEWLAGLRLGDEPLKENTVRSYRATIKYAKEAFGAKQLRHLTSADVTAFFELIAKAGSGSSTQALHRRVLHACIEAARHRTPPLVSVNVADRKKKGGGHAERRKASPFEQQELVKLWETLPEPYLTLCKLSASTGMRQGELIGLRWGAVDLTKRVIHVRSVYTDGIGFVDQPKSAESNREVILAPKVVDLLKDWKRRQEKLPAATALVFPGSGRDGQLIGSSARRALYAAMVAAGVPREWKPGHKMRDFHSFRHSFVSAAIGKGIGLEWIAEQLGHSSVSVTERHYKHFLTEARHELGAVLNDALLL